MLKRACLARLFICGTVRNTPVIDALVFALIVRFVWPLILADMAKWKQLLEFSHQNMIQCLHK